MRMNCPELGKRVAACFSAAAMLACLWVVAALAGCAGDAGSPSDGGAVETLDATSLNDAGATASSQLPFAIEGVPCGAAVVDVAGGASAADFNALWSFGGDYAEIGSFPLDAQTVFGSYSSNPDSLVSYGAALLGEGGFEVIDSPSVNPSLYYEPQDGSGDANRIVWRSSLLGGRGAGGERQLASAGVGRGIRNRAHAGHVAGDCRRRGRVLRVCRHRAHHECRERLLFDGGAGRRRPVHARAVLQPDGRRTRRCSGRRRVSAATDEGVVFASDPADAAADPFSYSKVSACEAGTTNPVLTVSSPDSSWHVSGVWASGDKRVVAFSSTDASAGSYLGVWADSFATPVAWLHAESPSTRYLRVEWLVWGRGFPSRACRDVRLQHGRRPHRAPWHRSWLLQTRHRQRQQRGHGSRAERRCGCGVLHRGRAGRLSGHPSQRRTQEKGHDVEMADAVSRVVDFIHAYHVFRVCVAHGKKCRKLPFLNCHFHKSAGNLHVHLFGAIGLRRSRSPFAPILPTVTS